MSGKAGRFAKHHEEYILDHYKTMTPEQIAIAIKKNPETVKKKMSQLGLQTYTKDERKEHANADIRNSPFWNQLKAELTTDELDLFVEHWKEIVSQFHDDIMHTEKLQIMDLIKSEILMSRDLAQEKIYNQVIQNCKKKMDEVENDPTLGPKEKEQKIQFIHDEYGINASLQKDVRGSYQKLQESKKNLLKEMKASRNQRLERIESSKENIQAWIVRLMDDLETRRKVGIEMEKMRLAMHVEYERLTDLHKFMDGELDRPILNSSVILKEMEDDIQPSGNA